MSNYRADEGTFCWMLEERTVDELKNLAKPLDIQVGKRKADTISNILELTNDVSLRELWGKTKDLEKKAVSEALYSQDKRYNQGKFKAKYGASPVWGNLSQYRLRKGTPPGLINFFFPWNHTIPSDLVPKLMNFVPKPDIPFVKTIPSVPESFNFDNDNIPLHTLNTERALLYELPAVLRLSEQGKVSVNDKTKTPTASTVKHFSKLLYGGDYFNDDKLPDWCEKRWNHRFHLEQLQTGPIRAVAWPRLLCSGKLLRKKGTKLTLAKKAKEALNTSTFAQLTRDLCNDFIFSDVYDEFNRINTIKGQTGKGKRGMTNPSHRKMDIWDALAECPLKEWIAVDEFSRYMQAADHSFEITLDPWGLYICEHRYGSLGYQGYHEWNIMEERYIKCIFMEYLATLGVIDIAFVHPAAADCDYTNMWGADDLLYLSRYDGLLYFRINSLGAYCLGHVEEYEPPVFEEAEGLKVLSNLDIVSMDKTPHPGDEFVLENFTEKKSDAHWKITKTRLFEAFEKGHSVKEFKDFLKAKSSCEIPETVMLLLDETKKRTEALTDKGEVRLLECESEEVAHLIVNSSSTKKYCMLAGKKHVVVFSGCERKFQTGLRKAGYASRIGS